jgi:hypothetical protein
VGGPNPLSAAFYTEHVLTDDVYADLEPTGFLDRTLFVPDVAVGRLLENPEEIIGQLALFEAAEGVLDPQTALTTGYDFLTDGALGVDEARGRRIAAADRSVLIDDDWTREDLRAALFPPLADSPEVAAVNAHFDHYRSLPAAADAAESFTAEDLFTIDDVEDGRLAGRVLFSMGCHGGLNVPDAYVATLPDGTSALPDGRDWPQVFSAEQAAVYVANTGFGYGGIYTVDLSERLMGLFAEHLDGSLTAGEALLFAKQRYSADMGLWGAYDEKALMEATFYGLPMYRIGEDPVEAPEPPEAPPVTTDPVTGLEAAEVRVEPDFSRIETDRGDFWTVA